MICINCLHAKTRIVNSRKHKRRSLTWRRHQCLRCAAVFTTREQPDGSYLQIAQRDTPTAHNPSIGAATGRPRQTRHRPFNLGKLIISIAASFQHNPIAASYDSLYLAQTVQDKLLRLQRKQLTAEDVCLATHQTLQAFDPIAAVQYAAQHQLLQAVGTGQGRRGRPSTRYAFSSNHSTQR